VIQGWDVEASCGRPVRGRPAGPATGGMPGSGRARFLRSRGNAGKRTCVMNSLAADERRLADGNAVRRPRCCCNGGERRSSGPAEIPGVRSSNEQL